jgi:hypothetical protein
MKHKIRIKVVFCDGTKYTHKPGKLTVKQVRKAPVRLDRDWAEMASLAATGDHITAADMWVNDEQDIPKGMNPEAHLVSVAFQFKPNKDEAWTTTWEKSSTCPCPPEPELPKLVTEIHRYSKPRDMWAFHSMEPDETHWWYLFPFSAPGAYEGDENFDRDNEPCYKESGITTRGLSEVEDYRGELWDQGYRRLEFTDDLPVNFRHYVIHHQCPLEWQVRMETGDQELFDRVVIWVQGELPVVS